MRLRLPSSFAALWLIGALYCIGLFVVTVKTMSDSNVLSKAEVLALEAGLLPLGLCLVVAFRQRFFQEVRKVSARDELTGLASRTFFTERVEDALARSQRNGAMMAVVFLDFDHFKRLNDTLGHAAGDRLLRDAAARLARTVRGGELAARLGGDEFTFLLEGVRNKDGAERMVARVFAQLERPFLIEGHEVLMTASVGIALNEGPRCSADELVRRADVALYRAKAAGRNCWKVFDQKGQPESAQSVEHLELGAQLKTAIDQNELRLYFQPEIDLVTGAIKGFEALVRWQHPNRGLLAPAAFIPPAEESGFIRAIGRWVLRAACLEAVSWEGRFPDAAEATISVNVSSSEFSARGFVAEVERTLANTHLNPARLKLEITETALMQDLPSALATMNELRLLGVKLAIDDFGTGYSSLNYLRRFPVDTLKIDQTFVREVDTDAKVRAIVQAIVVLAHALEIDVTAEGIETIGQLRTLMEANCDRAQGYLFARPLPVEALDDYLRAKRRDLEALATVPA
jgi:diguanylate cyclase (GGDEF)-like protein